MLQYTLILCINTFVPSPVVLRWKERNQCAPALVATSKCYRVKQTMVVTNTAPLSWIDHDQISGSHGILKFKAGTGHETFGLSKYKGTPHFHTSWYTVGVHHTSIYVLSLPQTSNCWHNKVARTTRLGRWIGDCMWKKLATLVTLYCSPLSHISLYRPMSSNSPRPCCDTVN